MSERSNPIFISMLMITLLFQLTLLSGLSHAKEENLAKVVFYVS